MCVCVCIWLKRRQTYANTLAAVEDGQWMCEQGMVGINLAELFGDYCWGKKRKERVVKGIHQFHFMVNSDKMEGKMEMSDNRTTL